MGADARVIPVRLCDIPLARRMRAALQCCKETLDAGERHELIYAAINPSSTVYWIRPGAEEAA